MSTRFFRIPPHGAGWPPFGAAYIALPLALISAGCAPSRPVSTPATQQAEATAWWAHSGDPLLDRLVSEALAREAAPSCALPPAALPARVARALHGLGKARAQAAALARQQAARRLALAQDIALAYLRARGWQARLSQRLAAAAMLKDNAEIARFRREAGLVPVLDEDMAGIMVGLNGSDVESARAALAAAVADLARLTGRPPEALTEALETTQAAPLNAFPAEAQAAPADSETARAAAASLAAAHQAARNREELAARADKALAITRLAYRNGAADFAALYVAEAAGLAGREAVIEAARAETAATLALWTARGRGETPQGPGCD